MVFQRRSRVLAEADADPSNHTRIPRHNHRTPASRLQDQWVRAPATAAGSLPEGRHKMAQAGGMELSRTESRQRGTAAKTPKEGPRTAPGRPQDGPATVPRQPRGGCQNDLFSRRWSDRSPAPSRVLRRRALDRQPPQRPHSRPRGDQQSATDWRAPLRSSPSHARSRRH